MRSRTRSLLLGSLAALALALAGCGSSNIRGALSSGSSSRISDELSSVSTAINDGSCGSARSALNQLDSTLSGLPAATNASLVSNLKQGAATVRSLALKECHGTQTQTTTSSSSSTTSTSTTPTVTSSSSTAPATTTQTETQTQSQTDTVPGTGGVTTLRSNPAPTSSTGINGGGGLGQ